jgi:hypothetical protein
MIVKGIKNWYFENTPRDKSKNILYVNVYFYLLVKKLTVIHTYQYITLKINIFNCMIVKIIKNDILKILFETNPKTYYMLMFIFIY